MQEKKEGIHRKFKDEKLLFYKPKPMPNQMNKYWSHKENKQKRTKKFQVHIFALKNWNTLKSLRIRKTFVFNSIRRQK